MTELHVTAALADGAASDRVVSLISAGVPVGASVGVKPQTTSWLAEGQTRFINRRWIKGPIRIVETGTLVEISVVAIAADDRTSVRLAARRAADGETMMSETDNVKPGNIDVLAAERARTSEILRIAEDFPDIRARAVSEGWSPKETELETMRAERPRVNARQPIRSAQANTVDVIASGFLMRCGKSALAEKSISPDACQRAEDLRLNTSPLMESCLVALRSENRDIPHGQHETIRAAFSTMSLPIALGLSANKLALDAYRNSPASWRSFCKILSLKDFKTHSMIRVHWGKTFDQVAPGGELHHGTIGEETYSLTGHTYGELLTIDRHDIINDDLGAFSGTAEALGRSAGRTVSDRVFACLLNNLEPDGTTPFFTGGRGNLLSGATTALGLNALASAVSDMISRTDLDGRIIDLRPAVLLVPPELEITAREILASQQTARYVSSGADGDRLPTGNPMFGQVELAIEPRLSNTGFTNNSAASWYLFSRREDGGVCLGFLHGVENPTIEQVDLSADVLGIGFRGFLDLGVSLADYRCCTMAAGS